MPHPKSKEELTDTDILQACMALNSKINQQINSLIKHYQKDPLLCAKFSPEALIKLLDPLLLQCIQALTKPVQQRRRLFSHQELLETSGTVQNKTIKQLYCLSTIFFCTNPQCNMPLHYLLSDAILCLGGSTELVKIFNRIGAVASMDTHDRVATYAVKDRMSKDIQFELDHNIFTITSVDNIDILQRHAMVSCTQSKRSWHGTSIQAVQPMPKETVASEQELYHTFSTLHTNQICEQIASDTVNPNKRGSSSPTMSPNPKQVEKRRRTLREKSSIHTQTQVSVTGRSEISSSMFANMYESTAYQRPAISQFTIRSFQLLPEEVSSLSNLQKTIFQYMVTKEAKSVELNMPGIASYLQSALYSSDTHEQSKVVYVDILSLPADSKDTVLRVLNNLYNGFIVGLGFHWLIVVGDANTEPSTTVW